METTTNVRRGINEGLIEFTTKLEVRKGSYSRRYEIYRSDNGEHLGWVVGEKSGWTSFRKNDRGGFEGILCARDFDTRAAAVEEMIWEVARTNSYSGPLADLIDAAAQAARVAS